VDATKFVSPAWGRAIRTEPPGSFAAFIPNDFSYYTHGSVKADIAAAKAAGYCASS